MNRRTFLACLASTCTAAQQPVFRVESRLVEILATVRDRRGRYVEGLTRANFEVTDAGEAQTIETVEENSASLSCAILLDTTGSMTQVLPVVKNAIVKLIGAFRPQDSVSVYSFANAVEKLQDFTSDKSSAVRAVMRTRPYGGTALFDAVSVVAGAVAPRKGMKAIVLFTDGKDNASRITGPMAVARARRAGVPIYAIAQGEALHDEHLMRRIEELSKTTGGQSYIVRKPQDVDRVFEGISAEINHTYLIAYRPPLPQSSEWRAVRVAIKEHDDYRVRAREGYFPE